MQAEQTSSRVLIRGSWFTRLGGPYMCLICVFGLTVIAWADPLEAIPVAIFWAAPGIWWGLRLARLSVVATSEGLIIRNPLRTYRVAWRDIRDVRLEKLKATPLERLTLFFLQFDRHVGVVETVTADRIQIYATESFWFAVYGRFFSQRPQTSASKVEVVRSAWRAAVG